MFDILHASTEGGRLPKPVIVKVTHGESQVPGQQPAERESGQRYSTSNPASAPVDIPGRDFGHLQFPEGGSLLCPFSYRQTGGATESPEYSNDMEVVEVPLKYVPGMLRTSHMEKMMTKEELEEEQRVQREQLAAIFQLLKENQETFGEVSEGDVEEQLRLYSI
ncbi:matrix-remodeling-associated protein 7-like isoform X3 [Oncorhynchus nerka]|uniref:matrix-remodeling-associated protein 7-like isoform X3 n=1 Tax=Oncorhynchus nerka TaxID=8023 RepID=UPI0011319CA2|nr:matrix-remodeling-associated protein 7-like isoform X3 [Oncorhynchus nerka]